jgi:hypothetical protein
VRIRFFVLAVGLALSACFPYPDSVPIYGHHSYSCCVETTGTRWWHAGQTVTLHWQATPPGRSSDPNPHQMVLSVSLTGPFVNVDALKQAISQGSKPNGVGTINAPPVFANDLMLNPASDLYLPADLRSGFYNVASQTAEGGQLFGGGGVIRIVRPDQIIPPDQS